jgi:transposase
MGNFSNFIGIDVSKKKVDLFSIRNSLHRIISNDEESLRKELSKLSSPEKTLVVIENTGAYERKAIKVLLLSLYLIALKEKRAHEKEK